MRSGSSRPTLKVLCLLALGGVALLCSGYTYLQVGVDSNFLVDEGRVLFVQADRTLTVLELDTGRVLRRDKRREYSGTLLRLPQGILMLNDRAIALLNPTNFDALWETTARFEPNVIGDDLVSYDGKGRVQCCSLRDGRIRWTYDLPGVLQVIAASGKVLVHRAAVYEVGSEPATVLLDQQSGKELFYRAPPTGTNWAAAFFDGTNIFVETGPFDEKRSDFRSERLAVWNTHGDEIDSIPLPVELRELVRNGQLFELAGKTFWKGRVYASRAAIPVEGAGPPISAAVQTNGAWKIFEATYHLGDGVSFIERAKSSTGTNRVNNAYAMEIELRGPTNNWKGVLTYLLDRGRIAAAAKADGKILIGTDLGQVECVKADTGESLWLYLFPTLHRTISFSSHDPPPTATEAAAIFQSENSSRPNSGLQVLNGKAKLPVIIVDPDKVEPFRYLRRHLAIAWTGVVLGIGLLLLVHVLPRTRQWGPGTLGSISAWMTFLLFGCYMFYGRVSPASSVALRVALAIGFIAGLGNALHSFRSGKKLEATVLAIVFAGIALFML